ncbi:MAG TPA: hypothetical protein VJ302_13990 [Blastocatellia bacterium]|nr:hypothetical protein [Blastocatellia bacterium]
MILIRLLFFVLAFAFVVYVLKSITRLGFQLRRTMKELRQLRQEANGGSAAGAEMQRCLSCGAFVSSRDAVVISSRGQSQVFCSQACMRVRIAS